MAVDPNNPDRVFIDTFDTWFATRTGTAFNDQPAAITATQPPITSSMSDQHALAFVPGDSDILSGRQRRRHLSLRRMPATRVHPFGRPGSTWTPISTRSSSTLVTSAEISRTIPRRSAVGGAQDNGPGSVQFAGSPTGPAQWQMGLGGDGFSGDPDLQLRKPKEPIS